MEPKPNSAETLNQRIDQIREVAHAAIKNAYGEEWERHRHSNFIDDLGNWHAEGQSRKNHDICPWPNIDYVIDVIAHAVAEQEQSSES